MNFLTVLAILFPRGMRASFNLVGWIFFAIIALFVLHLGGIDILPMKPH